MDGVSGEASQRQRGVWEHLLPLRYCIACSGALAGRERIADELMIRADRAMYEAKRAGKGRYKFADDDK